MGSRRARYLRAGAGAVFALVLLPFVGRSAGQRAGGGGAGGNQPIPMVIKAARVIDGRGKILTNTVVIVQGSKITYVGPQTKTTPPAMFNLGDVTVMPGMIDVHVHIDWHFQPNGLFGVRAGQTQETPEQAAAAIQKNLDATIQAGFTTIQSLGSPDDKALRDAIAEGTRSGPRILSSLGQLQPGTMTPDMLREQVRMY